MSEDEDEMSSLSSESGQEEEIEEIDSGIDEEYSSSEETEYSSESKKTKESINIKKKEIPAIYVQSNTYDLPKITKKNIIQIQ